MIHSRFLTAISAFMVVACLNSSPEYWIGGLHGGMDEGTVFRVLGADSADAQVVEESSLKLGDPRPRFDIKSFQLDFTDLGVEGALKVKLFNGTVTEAWFYPGNPDKYARKLAEKGIRLQKGSEVRTGNSTILIRGIDRSGREYFLWEDKKSSKSRDRWIKRYSGLGAFQDQRPV